MSGADPGPGNVEVEAIYGAESKRGLVSIKLGRQTTIVPPAKAREIAQFLIEAAGAAESDEAMMKVLERIGAESSLVLQFLLGLRTEREKIDERSRLEARRAIAYDRIIPDGPDAPDTKPG